MTRRLIASISRCCSLEYSRHPDVNERIQTRTQACEMARTIGPTRDVSMQGSTFLSQDRISPKHRQYRLEVTFSSLTLLLARPSVIAACHRF